MHQQTLLFFQYQRQIFGICTCCGEFFRLSDCKVYQEAKAPTDWPFYWAPDSGRSEVDFLIQKQNQVVPIEVKSAENLKSRSLRVYYDKFHPSTCIRTSLSGYQQQEWMQNIPMYGFHQWLRQELQ